MRGKQKCLAKSVYHARITPAHAGKTGTRLWCTAGSADHPRACGENDPAIDIENDEYGSPPRMRGKLCEVFVARVAARITPAHAGKTLAAKQRHSKDSDHPRACGENRLRQHRKRRAFGSPPRMRGKPSKQHSSSPFLRITPAHAGKTVRQGREACGRADHPRACGENHMEYHQHPDTDGSPPRMRGKRIGAEDGLFVERITPAHAGKTLPAHRG